MKKYICILLQAFAIGTMSGKKILPPRITMGSINNQTAQELTVQFQGHTFSFDNYRFDNDWEPVVIPEKPIIIRLGKHNSVTITLLPDYKTLEFVYNAPGAQGTVHEEVTTPRATIEVVTTALHDPIQTFVTLRRQ